MFVPALHLVPHPGAGVRRGPGPGPARAAATGCAFRALDRLLHRRDPQPRPAWRWYMGSWSRERRRLSTVSLVMNSLRRLENGYFSPSRFAVEPLDRAALQLEDHGLLVVGLRREHRRAVDPHDHQAGLAARGSGPRPRRCPRG